MKANGESGAGGESIGKMAKKRRRRGSVAAGGGIAVAAKRHAAWRQRQRQWRKAGSMRVNQAKAARR